MRYLAESRSKPGSSFPNWRLAAVPLEVVCRQPVDHPPRAVWASFVNAGPGELPIRQHANFAAWRSGKLVRAPTESALSAAKGLRRSADEPQPREDNVAPRRQPSRQICPHRPASRIAAVRRRDGRADLATFPRPRSPARTHHPDTSNALGLERASPAGALRPCGTAPPGVAYRHPSGRNEA
jgi:hypothetical protein